MAQSAELHKPGGKQRAGAGNSPVNGQPSGAPGEPSGCLARLSQDQTAAELWNRLSVLKPARRRQWVKTLAECGDGRACKLLSAALWDENAEVALAAAAGLRAGGDLRAAASLDWLGEISRVPRVAEAARAAAAAIRARCGSMTGPEGLPGAPLEHWASFIDGDGAQLLMVIRPASGARRRLAVAAVSDQRGILDAWGTDSVSREEAAALRNAGSRRRPAAGAEAAVARRWTSGGEEERAEIGWTRVDSGYCAAAIDAALAIHRRDRRRLPGVWEIWRHDFEGSKGAELAPAMGEPEDRLRRRLAQTTTLIHFEGFRSWLLLGEDLAPFLPAVHEAARQRGSEREERLARVISICLATLFRGRERRLWRERLLRQGALWERRGDRIVRELCLAAAWGLQERGVPAEQHPLLRAMARASLEVAVGIEDWNKTGG